MIPLEAETEPEAVPKDTTKGKKELEAGSEPNDTTRGKDKTRGKTRTRGYH